MGSKYYRNVKCPSASVNYYMMVFQIFNSKTPLDLFINYLGLLYLKRHLKLSHRQFLQLRNFWRGFQRISNSWPFWDLNFSLILEFRNLNLIFIWIAINFTKFFEMIFWNFFYIQIKKLFCILWRNDPIAWLVYARSLGTQTRWNEPAINDLNEIEWMSGSKNALKQPKTLLQTFEDIPDQPIPILRDQDEAKISQWFFTWLKETLIIIFCQSITVWQLLPHQRVNWNLPI